MNVILDLDNTLICALTKEELKTTPINKFFLKKNKYKIKYDYVIFKRPYLKQFLNYIFKNFKVTVWTAATKEYGKFIIENILKKNIKKDLVNFFYRETCEKSEKIYPGSPKNLKYLYNNKKYKYKPCNTIIIDDLNLVFKENGIGNVIKIPYFDVSDKNSHNDDALLKIIYYLKDIKKYGSQCDEHPWD